MSAFTQLEVPHFNISDETQQQEAQRMFTQLGITVPMISIQVGKVGELTDGYNGDEQNFRYFDEDKAEDYFVAIQKAFAYFTEDPVIPIMTRYYLEDKGFPFWPLDHRDVSETRTQVGEGGRWHNDLSASGNGAIVYAAHLTTFGSGIVNAGLASIDSISEGRMHFKEKSTAATHSRQFHRGDVHIHVRQAPNVSGAEETLAPTTHSFISLEQRGHIETSWGLQADWQHARPVK